MNREKLINKFDKDTGYFINTPIEVLHLARYNFILLVENLELYQKENTRLKKQLSKDHHIEYSCSFCKPVGEKQSCENCRHYDGTQTCNKFVARSSYNYKDFYCNKWELKC